MFAKRKRGLVTGCDKAKKVNQTVLLLNLPLTQTLLILTIKTRLKQRQSDWMLLLLLFFLTSFLLNVNIFAGIFVIDRSRDKPNL